MRSTLETPIVLVLFNRPQHTRLVLEAISAARPQQLFVIADGPRADRPEDVIDCQAARHMVESAVDWPCTVHRDFSDVNLGCAKRIRSGLDAVFEQVDRAIILEDDCVPQSCFFRFCSELLDRYQQDERVRTIAGSNFLRRRVRTDWSYYYSNFHNIWGWATWRRSWQQLDLTMSQWPQVRSQGWLLDILGSDNAAKFFLRRLQRTYEGHIDSWAYPYQLSCWLDHGVAITPNRNLVENVGGDAEATNTRGMGIHRADKDGMEWPLVHPPFMVVDRLSDREMLKQVRLREERSWWWRMARYLYRSCGGRRRQFVFPLLRGELVDREQLSKSTRKIRSASRVTA